MASQANQLVPTQQAQQTQQKQQQGLLSQLDTRALQLDTRLLPSWGADQQSAAGMRSLEPLVLALQYATHEEVADWVEAGVLDNLVEYSVTFLRSIAPGRRVDPAQLFEAFRAISQKYPARQYAREMLRCGASARWVDTFCKNYNCIVDSFTLLMSLSEMLPLSWQMDWWTGAAGALTAAGYTEALRILASAELAKRRNPQIVLAMQFFRSMSKGLRNLEEHCPGREAALSTSYSASKQLVPKLRGIPAPPGVTIHLPPPTSTSPPVSPAAPRTGALAPAASSRGTLVSRRSSIPMLCSSMLLASEQYKCCLKELLAQVERGSQGATGWQLAAAAVWHSIKVCSMSGDTAAVAGKFCASGMGEALLTTLGRICADTQALTSDSAMRDTLELLLGVLDQCRQHPQLHAPARSGGALAALVRCAKELRDLYGSLQLKLLACALDLAAAATTTPDAPLLHWPGLQDTCLDWLAGIWRGWYTPVLTDSHEGMARERSDILLAALTILGQLLRNSGPHVLTLEQLQRGRVGHLAACLPWPGLLPEESVHLCHVQACCLRLGAQLLGAQGEAVSEDACGRVVDMFGGSLRLAVQMLRSMVPEAVRREARGQLADLTRHVLEQLALQLCTYVGLLQRQEQLQQQLVAPALREAQVVPGLVDFVAAAGSSSALAAAKVEVLRLLLAQQGDVLACFGEAAVQHLLYSASGGSPLSPGSLHRACSKVVEGSSSSSEAHSMCTQLSMQLLLLLLRHKLQLVVILGHRWLWCHVDQQLTAGGSCFQQACDLVQALFKLHKDAETQEQLQQLVEHYAAVQHLLQGPAAAVQQQVQLGPNPLGGPAAEELADPTYSQLQEPEPAAAATAAAAAAAADAPPPPPPPPAAAAVSSSKDASKSSGKGYTKGTQGSGSSSKGKARSCAQCGSQPPKFKLCAGCKSTRYCSAECQKAHWTHHMLLCPAGLAGAIAAAKAERAAASSSSQGPAAAASELQGR